MTSSRELVQLLCATCNKAKGIYKCQGCSQVFCTKHSNDHRNELNKQLEEITMTHDLVHQTLNQHIEDPQKHPTIQEINRWEKKSIDLIRTTAEKWRGKLLEDVNEDITQVKQKLRVVSKEMREGREENDFTEIDLQQWTTRLETLRIELLNPPTITIQQHSTCLINAIRIDRQNQSDVFERVSNNAQITEDGRLLLKNDLGGHAEIRGKTDYKTGIHTIQFQIERLEQNGWIFFGVISKDEAMRNRSFRSPSSCGWSNKNQIFSCGQYSEQQTLEIIENDRIVLIIDCDQRRIKLTNNRLKHSVELFIDINICSFPWQLHLNLNERNTRVRILD